MKRIALLLMVLWVAVATYGQAPFAYASGRLFEDPETGESLHSPYLSYAVNGEQQWIAYDPSGAEGRFLSVASSFTGAVACGFVQGRLEFLGKRLMTPETEPTGVVAAVRPDGTLDWFYAHNPGIMSSRFQWVAKLRDGRSVVSGYEQTRHETAALLLFLDREGNLTHHQRIPHAKGFEVRANAEGELYWMVANEVADGRYRTALHQVDPHTATFIRTIEQEGTVALSGLRGSVTFDVDKNGDVRTARVLAEPQGSIRVDRYGEVPQTATIPIPSETGTTLDLTGIAVRASGNVQLAVNVSGTVQLNGTDPVRTSGKKDILLLTLTPDGDFLGYEQFTSDLAGVNGFYRSGEKLGIVGCHQGHLTIQQHELEGSKADGAARSYAVLLDEYVPMVAPEDLDLDPARSLGKLTAYPNPVVDGTVTIRNPMVTDKATYELRIYDSKGKLQLVKTQVATSTQSEDALDVHALASGLYQVYCLQGSTVTHTGRFLITH